MLVGVDLKDATEVICISTHMAYLIFLLTFEQPI